jgi:hypothetical protein
MRYFNYLDRPEAILASSFPAKYSPRSYLRKCLVAESHSIDHTVRKEDFDYVVCDVLDANLNGIAPTTARQINGDI